MNARQVPAPPLLLRRGLILIVDDDPVFTLLASETLEQSGFETLIAGDVALGMALFEERRPDLLLLDVDVAGEKLTVRGQPRRSRHLG